MIVSRSLKTIEAIWVKKGCTACFGLPGLTILCCLLISSLKSINRRFTKTGLRVAAKSRDICWLRWLKVSVISVGSPRQPTRWLH
jgi:hypothetical protein